MIKIFSASFTWFFSLATFAQSFSPAAGMPGSTAVHKDSAVIVGWATTCVVSRGPKQIDQPQFGLASFGGDIEGAGKAEGNSLNVVSLGDGGFAVLTFNPPIKNGIGNDFAVFENGFLDHYMEFAFVEVSSNGADYFRFPSVSETPLVPQMNNASFGNCAYVHNLAGKYRQGFGTPFDLEDLDSIPNLDLNSITHVRLVDVIGSTNVAFGTTDFQGNLINDPWPTNFESSGFDLDGVGVMNQGELSISKQLLTFEIFPNPFTNILNVNTETYTFVSITNQMGQVVYKKELIGTNNISVDHLEAGSYFLRLKNSLTEVTVPLVKF